MKISILCISKIMPKFIQRIENIHTYQHTKFNKRHKVFSNFPFFIKKSFLQKEDSGSIFCVKLSFLVGGKGYFCHSVLNVTKHTKSQKRKRRVDIRNMCFCWHSQNTGKLSSRWMPFTEQVRDAPDLLCPGSLHWAGSLCIQAQAEQIQAASESWCPLTQQVSRLGDKIRIRRRSHKNIKGKEKVCRRVLTVFQTNSVVEETL